MLLKCCTQCARKLGKLSSGRRTGKVVLIPIPKKGNAKECSNYSTIALISHASRVMFKILQQILVVVPSLSHVGLFMTQWTAHQAWLQQYMNQEITYVQAGF